MRHRPFRNNTEDRKTGATIINAAGEAEAIGWKDILENIRQNVSDSSSKEIYIVAGSDTVVPAEVLQSVMGSNLSLRIEIEEELAWIIEGQEITENVGDIDFGILRSADRIPAELITQTTQGHDLFPSLVHDGGFGMTAKLSVRLAQRISVNMQISSTITLTMQQWS